MVLLTHVYKIFIIIRFGAYVLFGLTFIEYRLCFHYEMLLFLMCKSR